MKNYNFKSFVAGGHATGMAIGILCGSIMILGVCLDHGWRLWWLFLVQIPVAFVVCLIIWLAVRFSER
jgi:hypothetical protein